MGQAMSAGWTFLLLGEQQGLVMAGRQVCRAAAIGVCQRRGGC